MQIRFPVVRQFIVFSLVATFCASMIGCGGGDEKASKRKKFGIASGKNDEAPPEIGSKGSSGIDFNPGELAKQKNVPAGQGGIASGTGGQPTRMSSQSLTPPADATPTQLVEFAESLMKQRPAAQTKEQYIAMETQLTVAAQTALDKALRADLDVEVRRRAVDAKFLTFVRRISPPVEDAKVVPMMRSFAAEMAKDEDPQISTDSKLLMLDLRLNDVVNGKETDPAKVAKEVTALLNDETISKEARHEQRLLDRSQAVAMMLDRMGGAEVAKTLYGDIGRRFIKSENKEIAEAARALIQQEVFTSTEYDAKLRAVADDASSDEKKQAFIEALDKVLELEDPTRDVLERVYGSVVSLESDAKLALAKEIIDRLENVVKGLKDEKLQKEISTSVEAAKKRQTLLGQTYEIEGANVTGGAFDASQLKGKVVFVDFWATWSVANIREIPVQVAIHRKYKEKGFEIVGVVLDDDITQFAAQYRQSPLPWPNIVTADPKNVGLKTPLAVRTGVDRPPFSLLLDRDGKVIAMHLRGAQLEAKLEELLGDKTGPDKTGADKTGPDKTGGAPAKKEDGKEAPAKKEAVKEGDAKADGAKKAPAKTEAAPKETSKKESGKKESGKKESGKKEAGKKEAGKKDGAHLATGDGYFFVSTQADDETDEGEEKEPENPYLADSGLSASKLIDFIFDMQDKPKVIQRRPGFSAAIVDAAERALDDKNISKRDVVLATTIKLEMLHKMASDGDAKADEKLLAYAKKLGIKHESKRIAKEVEFLLLEQKVIKAAEAELKAVPEVLKEAQDYLKGKTLTARHLRLASSLIVLVNRFEAEQQREPWYGKFGNLFAESKNKELARYGRKLAKPKAGPKKTDLVGKPLELAGVTASGTAFDWKKLRGKVVIVDFWATWCGPCIKEMPNVKAAYAKYNKKGFEIVGVSLDKDLEKLGEFLDKNDLPWTNLAGEETQKIAQTYGIRAIPTMILVDQKGNVVASAHRIGELTEKLEGLLTK